MSPRRKRTTSAERIAEYGFDPARPDREELIHSFLLANGHGVFIEPDGDCWLYRGRNHRPGTYSFLTAHKRSFPVHRAFYALTHPADPHPEHVHHRCERPDCVRPEHLIGLTAAQHGQVHAALEAGQSVALHDPPTAAFPIPLFYLPDLRTATEAA